MNHPCNRQESIWHQESIWMSQGELALEEWPGWRPELEPYEEGIEAQPALWRLSDPCRLTSGLKPGQATDSYFLCHPDLYLAESRLLESLPQRGRSCLRC